MLREASVAQVHAEQVDVDGRQRVEVVGATAPVAIEVISVEGSRQPAREPVAHGCAR